MSVDPVPVLDAGALDRLEGWGGAELRAKMVDLFFKNAPERVRGIRDGLATNDLELAERSAHSLKSSAANLGGEAVRQLAAKIEGAFEVENRAGAEALLPELEARCAETLEALRKVEKRDE
ncbi:MAG: Hpt domain-containing protein [Gemmatimonadetes bacterium]|nr:Hpt domain-containing protein [Gemmatimonadota bacterium]